MPKKFNTNLEILFYVKKNSCVLKIMQNVQKIRNPRILNGYKKSILICVKKQSTILQKKIVCKFMQKMCKKIATHG